MKKTAVIVLLALCSTAFAQKPSGLMDKPEQKEKIDAMRIAFITENVELTPDQAKLFWPVYEEFKRKNESIRAEQLEHLKMKKEEGLLAEDLSEKELDEMMTTRFSNEQKALDLKREYHEKFKGVLEIRQVAALYKAEHEFKRHLFERMRRGDRKERDLMEERPPR